MRENPFKNDEDEFILQHAFCFLGNHQSPVDIDPDTAEIDDTLEKHPLVAKYIPENVNTITNTGTTIKIDYDCRDSSKCLGKTFS